MSRLRRPRALDDARQAGAGGAERGLDAGRALAGCEQVGGQRAYKVDAVFVARLEQHLSGRRSRAELVWYHGRHPGVGRERVEQHQPVPAGRLRHGHLAREHRCVDEPVDLPVEHVVDEPPLELVVALGLGDEKQMAALDRGVDGAAHGLACKRVGRDRVRYEPDGPGDLRAQAAGGQVRPVAELRSRCANAFLGRLRDAHVLASGEHERRGGGRHPRGAGHVGEPNPAGHAWDRSPRTSEAWHSGPEDRPAAWLRTRSCARATGRAAR